MGSESTEVTQGHLRTLNLNIVFASLSAIGALLISLNADGLADAVVLAVGLAATLVAARGWTEDRVSRVAFPSLAVAAAVWVVGVLVLDNASSSFAIASVGSVVVFQLPQGRRRAAVLALLAFVVAVVAARLVMSREDLLPTLAEYLVGSTSVAVVGVIFAFLNHIVSGLITQLEDSRERDAELAVARERVRFASDLHDIQGHTLHVVKLKVSLAKKLLHTDIARVEHELGEVHALVGDTISQTKALAYAQRRLNLSAELENAKNLFEAAGISVRVDTEDEVDPRAGEMLGQVLRETTTNILRHAQAEQVRITLSRAGITIVNDGAQEAPLPELRGLATLRERVADSGGALALEQRGGRFVTSATFPGLRAGAPL